jgi:Flp pilus assembly protein TadB
VDFGTTIIVVSIAAVLVAAASYWGAGRMYRSIGSSDLVMERETRPAAADSAEAREEIRQMLEAKSARREARGEPPLDVDAEMAALGQGSAEADPGLREEVRQLVVARNERRMRQGKEPLDVEAEVERQLRSLGG